MRTLADYPRLISGDAQTPKRIRYSATGGRWR
nr:MAG TPA: hypothetical protein [Caudoviricetes sp.]